MIFKSTKSSREYWAKFMNTLQRYNIVDSKGNIIPKREAFDKYFDEGSIFQPQIELIMSDHHQEYFRAPRTGYDKSILEKQYIEEVTDDVLKVRAVRIFRGATNGTDTMESVVELMVRAMADAMENKKIIDQEIKRRVENIPTPSSG